MHPLNWLIVVGYLLYVVIDGVRRAKGTKELEGYFLANHELGAFDTSLRYSGKLFNKTMLVEATAAYHRQRDNDVPSGVQGQSASALRDLPSVSWQGTRNLLTVARDAAVKKFVFVSTAAAINALARPGL